ncbi:unnamed protein product [Musa acuminata subsp. burmannicoides]
MSPRLSSLKTKPQSLLQLSRPPPPPPPTCLSFCALTMEGLIPFVYKAIVRYKNGGQVSNIGSLLFHDSPSASYVRLPAGDSGRFLSSDVRFFPSSPRPPTAPAAPQSPRRRVAQWRTA